MLTSCRRGLESVHQDPNDRSLSTGNQRGEGRSSSSPPPATCDVQEDHASDIDSSTIGEDWNELEDDIETRHRYKVWKDDIEGFETKVLKAVGYDLTTAAFLIPQLYSKLYLERSPAVGVWASVSTQCPGQSESPSRNTATSQSPPKGSSNTNGKKRKSCQDKSDGDLGESQDENEDGDKDQTLKRARASSNNDAVRYACPFHKWKPDKYNAFYEANEVGRPRYGACQGPGFSNLSRLK